ncbi:hypothetical protein ABGB16_00030 [Micromonospora sp. B11E3]|uniref:hypothetical protein n=1 Tax=Micromonospora sp. B11E3 TaxID=3153562 RepID=UPI00325CC891
MTAGTRIDGPTPSPWSTASRSGAMAAGTHVAGRRGAEKTVRIHDPGREFESGTSSDEHEEVRSADGQLRRLTN